MKWNKILWQMYGQYVYVCDDFMYIPKSPVLYKSSIYKFNRSIGRAEGCNNYMIYTYHCCS